MIKINNLLNFYTFLLLKSKPRHGYELIKELSRKLGKEISASQVYPFLEKMKKEKLILVKSTGERQKKVYYLTLSGRKMAKKLLSLFSDLIDAVINKKISKCEHCGCEVYGKSYTKEVGGRIRKFCCKYCARER